MKALDKKKLEFYNAHGGGLSRRQFVGLGLLGATSTILLPQFLSLQRGSFAFGSESGAPEVAYLGFDLAGGAALPGNFLVGGPGGPEDLLTKYDKLGWDPRLDGYDTRFGLPMPKAEVSMLFKGLTQSMSEGAQKNFRMASVAHFGLDDTSNNPLSILELLSSIPVMNGKKIKKGLGTYPSPSGGRSRGLISIPKYSPLRITSGKDFKNLLSISPSVDALSLNLKKRFAMALLKLKSSQLPSLGASPAEMMLFNENYQNLELLLSNPIELDPRKLSDTSSIYGLKSDTLETDRSLVNAGIANCVLNKVTGPGVITIEGCDYHDGTQKSGDAKDLEIGQEIGRAIELAHQRQIPLFIHLFTDGGCSADYGGRIWRSDSGDKSMSVMGFYNPREVPSYVDKSRVQIGHYTQGQGANRETFLGSSPALVSYAVLANVMNVMGKLSEFNDYMPNPFTRDQLESLIVFNQA